MGALSVALQYYIHLRLNNTPGWQSIKVWILIKWILSTSGSYWFFDPRCNHCCFYFFNHFDFQDTSLSNCIHGALHWVIIWRLYCPTQMSLVKENTKSCPTSGCSAIFLALIQIHDIVSMDWWAWNCFFLKIILQATMRKYLVRFIVQDADLIMLALVTHEVHFSILREVCSSSHPL